jgi:hypothetical protein
MTEEQWLTCTDPGPMLEFLRGKAGRGRVRLLICAACRRLWPWVPNDRSREAVAYSERYADGSASLAELRRAC